MSFVDEFKQDTILNTDPETIAKILIRRGYFVFAPETIREIFNSTDIEGILAKRRLPAIFDYLISYATKNRHYR